MGLFQKLFGRGTSRTSVQKQDVLGSLDTRDLAAAAGQHPGGAAAHRSVDTERAQPSPVRPAIPELRERLYHVTSGAEAKALVDELNEEQVAALVASLHLGDMPLNAFCTDRFQFNGLDDRMVAVTFVALRLLESGRTKPLAALLDKLAAKFERKHEIGASPGGPSHTVNEPWRIGESLMKQIHVLAVELLKREGHDKTAAALLEGLLTDYPDRLEAAFWLAAATHNLYIQAKDGNVDSAVQALRRKRALRAIYSFLSRAKGDPSYRANVEALQKLRRENYGESTTHTSAGKADGRRPTEPAALTTGTHLTGVRQRASTQASKAGRAGKCRDCGTVVALTRAKGVCLDWDGVDAYHFYCPSCYISTRDPHYYTGQLLGSDGKAVIDQHSWEYEG